MSAIGEPVAQAGLTQAQKGVLFCLIAHLCWGGMAYYFGLLRQVSALEIAVHRGLWSVPIAGAVAWALGLMPGVARAAGNPRILATLAFTSFLIAFNWGFYVWSIEAGRTLESSLGYYINPLFNVVAGFLFLNERFTRAQVLAIALAAGAVVIQTLGAGVFPWLGLLLGATFSLYGFIRKTIAVGPVEGFFIEVCLLAPAAVAAALWLAHAGQARFLTSPRDTVLLIGCGVLTSTSLLLFAAAIKRIRYSTAGLMQYISPTLVFLTAVFVFGEPLDRWRLVSFALIWVGLAIFSVSGLNARARHGAKALEPATL